MPKTDLRETWVPVLNVLRKGGKTLQNCIYNKFQIKSPNAETISKNTTGWSVLNWRQAHPWRGAEVVADDLNREVDLVHAMENPGHHAKKYIREVQSISVLQNSKTDNGWGYSWWTTPPKKRSGFKILYVIYIGCAF